MTVQQVLCRPYGQSFDSPGYVKAKKKAEKCELFLNGKEHKKRVNAGVKKEKILTSNSTVLNNELNWGDTDWNKEREEIKLLLSKSKTIKCN